MPKATTSERVRRLTALLGRLHKGAEMSLAELAAEVGATPAELAEDLQTLSFCGVAPYDPLASVPVTVDDGVVSVWGEMPAPTEVVRLSTAQASALAAALQVAGITASDDLASRLLAAKSAGFNAADLEHTVRAAIDSHSDSTYATLALAMDEWQVVRIEHVRTGEATATPREIEPVALFSERGAWYVQAWCRSADDWRTFRLDRISDAKATGEEFRVRSDQPPANGAFDAAELPVARLRFAPGERFVEREWPGGRIVGQEPDGSAIAEVPFADTSWLARHVAARLGRVEALEPAGMRAAVRQIAAEDAGLRS